jgi:hypothetical protein
MVITAGVLQCGVGDAGRGLSELGRAGRRRGRAGIVLLRMSYRQFSWPPVGLGQGAVTAMFAEACLGLLLIATMTAVALRRTPAARH